MKQANRIRKWATPVTIGAFILSSVTGIMLLFKAAPGAVRPVHEWLSLVLVAGTIFHVIPNWKSFRAYFSSRLARVIVGVFLLMTCAAMIPFGGREGGSGDARLSGLLVRMPLSSVAAAAGHDPGEAVTLLGRSGVRVEGSAQSIGEIAKENGKNPVDILNVIF